MNRVTGIILIIIGAAMLIWTGFTYTKKEKVIDAGPIQVSADKEKTVSWPPYLGGVLLIGGIVIVATSKSENTLSNKGTVWVPLLLNVKLKI